MKKLKKTMLLAVATTMCILTGCSKLTDLTVPESRDDDLSEYTVNNAEDVTLEGYINSQHNGDKILSDELDEFDDFTTIKVNDYQIHLNETTVSDIVSNLNLKYKWDENLNCFKLYSDCTVMMLYTVDNNQNENAITRGLTVCNLLSELNDLSVEFLSINNSTLTSDTISQLGEASSYANSETTSNYKWTWKSDALNQKVSYQMMWYEGQVSQIDLMIE
jgi:hypothetical protein